MNISEKLQNHSKKRAKLGGILNISSPVNAQFYKKIGQGSRKLVPELLWQTRSRLVERCDVTPALWHIDSKWPRKNTMEKRQKEKQNRDQFSHYHIHSFHELSNASCELNKGWTFLDNNSLIQCLAFHMSSAVLSKSKQISDRSTGISFRANKVYISTIENLFISIYKSWKTVWESFLGTYVVWLTTSKNLFANEYERERKTKFQQIETSKQKEKHCFLE